MSDSDFDAFELAKTQNALLKAALAVQLQFLATGGVSRPVTVRV